jgi:alkylhydroperoxidase family enzyme
MSPSTDIQRAARLPSVESMECAVPQRIPYPSPIENESGIYGPLTNGQQIARHLAPKVLEGVTAMSSALMRHGLLPAPLRELIIVRTGYHAGSRYEVVQHASLAERHGVSRAKLEALAYVDPQGLDPKERAAIRFVDELLDRTRPRDEILGELKGYFGYPEIFEIIFITGNWWTLARMLETAGIPLEEGRIGNHGITPPSQGGA